MFFPVIGHQVSHLDFYELTPRYTVLLAQLIAAQVINKLCANLKLEWWGAPLVREEKYQRKGNL